MRGRRDKVINTQVHSNNNFSFQLYLRLRQLTKKKKGGGGQKTKNVKFMTRIRTFKLNACKTKEQKQA